MTDEHPLYRVPEWTITPGMSINDSVADAHRWCEEVNDPFWVEVAEYYGIDPQHAETLSEVWSLGFAEGLENEQAWRNS